MLCLGSYQSLHSVVELKPFLLCLIYFFLLFPSNSTTAESLTNQNEAELQRRFQERQQEIDQMQQVLETKIQLLQEVRPLKTYMSSNVTNRCAAQLRMTSFF